MGTHTNIGAKLVGYLYCLLVYSRFTAASDLHYFRKMWKGAHVMSTAAADLNLSSKKSGIINMLGSQQQLTTLFPLNVES